MVRLNPDAYPRINALYMEQDIFYPLIAAVLSGEQNGTVYADDVLSPSQAYVEHSFGFAQVFGCNNKSFEHKLERYLLMDKQFCAAKVRLYGPDLPSFITLPENDPIRSWRQRFVLDQMAFQRCQAVLPAIDSCTAVSWISTDNFSQIEKQFGVVDRFWRNSSDFIRKAHAVTVLLNGIPAALCYGAAEANGQIEIDVMTALQYRSLGLAKLATIRFVERSLDLSLRPLWDCFTNNEGSMALCRSIGFVPARPAYPFYTINRTPINNSV